MMHGQKNIKLFLICLPEYPRFNTIRSYGPHSSSNLIKCAGEKGLLFFQGPSKSITYFGDLCFLGRLRRGDCKIFPLFSNDHCFFIFVSCSFHNSKPQTDTILFL